MEDEDFDHNSIDEDQVVTNKSENTMLFVEEDGRFYDVETLDHIAYLGAIRLIQRRSFIMKLKNGSEKCLPQ